MLRLQSGGGAAAACGIEYLAGLVRASHPGPFDGEGPGAERRNFVIRKEADLPVIMSNIYNKHDLPPPPTFVVEITTGLFTARHKETVAYSVADLVTPIPNSVNQQALQQQATLFGQFGAAGGLIGQVGAGQLAAFGQVGGALGAGGAIGALGALGALGGGALGAGLGAGLGAIGALGAGLGARSVRWVLLARALVLLALVVLWVLRRWVPAVLWARSSALVLPGFRVSSTLVSAARPPASWVASLASSVTWAAEFGFQGGTQEGILMLTIRQLVGQPEDWAAVVPGLGGPGTVPVGPGEPMAVDDPKAGLYNNNQIGYFPSALALVVKGTSLIHSRTTRANVSGMGCLRPQAVGQPTWRAPLGIQRGDVIVIGGPRATRTDSEELAGGRQGRPGGRQGPQEETVQVGPRSARRLAGCP